MSHSNDNASPLLIQHLELFKCLPTSPAVLDLACGYGRNGIFLLNNNVPVIFADNSRSALDAIAEKLKDFDQDLESGEAEFKRADSKRAEYWEVDLERGEQDPLAGRTFAGVMVFNYLHRPLMEAIKKAIIPGGLIIYETFTEEQSQFGRPSNPDYLLKPKELEYSFRDWDILHSSEGHKQNPERAVASIVARKSSNDSRID